MSAQRNDEHIPQHNEMHLHDNNSHNLNISTKLERRRRIEDLHEERRIRCELYDSY